MKLSFSIANQDQKARRGDLVIGNIALKTPMFMPVGTCGTVKALTMPEVFSMGYQLILGNTYHLYLRPGDELIAQQGGLHDFTQWKGAFLTDSGGFQIYSLKHFTKITDESATFRSHIDGSTHVFTPEKIIQIQENLGSNIMMVLDQCLELPISYDKAAEAMQRSVRWAKRCFEARKSQNNLFAIIQGADFPELRQESAERSQEIDFDGFAIGGLSVGEEKSIMYEITNMTANALPQKKPRYLMGVGDPVDLLYGIEAGVDLFDCVLPTRNARNGGLFTSRGKLSIKNSRYKEDSRPLDENCSCEVCQNYSRSYLRHLFLSKEILASRLNSFHNLYFLKNLMDQAQNAIEIQNFGRFKTDFLRLYESQDF